MAKALGGVVNERSDTNPQLKGLPCVAGSLLAGLCTCYLSTNRAGFEASLRSELVGEAPPTTRHPQPISLG